MLTKAITYENYNGEKRTQNFYFNLTKAELMEMELGVEGGMQAMLERVINAQDIPTIAKLFKQLVLKSYGVKSADGRRFIKTPEVTEEFTQTPAFSEIYMTLATDEKYAAEFVNGIIPNDYSVADADELIEAGKQHIEEKKASADNA